jgi:hypothetical protein
MTICPTNQVSIKRGRSISIIYRKEKGESIDRKNEGKV